MEISEFHIIGRIGKAAIMDKVAFLDIASNYRRKVDDEWVDDTHWNRVTFFGKHIARVAKMSVGDLVHVRSEEHTSELQSLMRISYAVFCLKKKKKNKQH